MKRYTMLALPLALIACKDESGAGREQAASKLLQDQAAVIVGMPAIQNFTEKRMLKMLYELRDNANLVTYSYYVDMAGNRHKVCPTTSLGYGIPFSAQYTAPHALRRAYPLWSNGETSSVSETYNAEQPEPNGIYMPDSSSATWVMCMDPQSKQATPVYVEPSIIVSPFPMD